MEYHKVKIIIKNNSGLHARPCSAFVKAANSFESKIKVKKGENSVDGKSIIGLMTLAAAFGDKITIEASGPDAKKQLLHLKKLQLLSSINII